MNISTNSRVLSDFSNRTIYKQKAQGQSAFLPPKKADKTAATNPNPSAPEVDQRPEWQIMAPPVLLKVSEPEAYVQVHEWVVFDKSSTEEKPIICIGDTGVLIDPLKVDISNCTQAEMAAYCCYIDACMRRDGIPCPECGSYTVMKRYALMDGLSKSSENPPTYQEPSAREIWETKKNWKAIVTSISKMLLKVKDYGQYLEGKKILDWWEREKK